MECSGLTPVGAAVASCFGLLPPGRILIGSLLMSKGNKVRKKEVKKPKKDKKTAKK